MTSVLVDDDLQLAGDTLFLGSIARATLEDGAGGARDAPARLYETPIAANRGERDLGEGEAFELDPNSCAAGE